jgi:signal transduction histidine kinase
VEVKITDVQVKSSDQGSLDSSEDELIVTKKPEQTLYIAFDLIVQDFGCGMSAENLSKLFIDFNKIEENASLNRNGVGLGLSICKMLIEQMAGSVNVKSSLGEGT